MGLRMIAPKRVKKVKSANSQEVLDRLQRYLDKDFDEPIKILCGFWHDQQDAISYQELRQAVREGKIDSDTLNLWMQDYSVLVAGRFNSIWSDAIIAGSEGQPILDGLPFEFSTQTPGIANWIKNRGAQFVTDCTEEQQSAIAALLNKNMRDCHTVDELARMIRPCIGLTESDVKAVMRYYDSIVDTYRNDHPRMKAESIRQRARDAAQKYAERKHRQRALTIAQTESAFAYNWGADEGIRQAQEQNLIGVVKKYWSTSGNDGVCDICAALDGVEIDMDGEFNFNGRELFAGQKRLPPAHPHCCCAVLYIEVEEIKMHKFLDLIGKSAGGWNNQHDDVVKGRFQIMKSDDDKMLAFGWASVAMRVDGEVVVDWQKDIIEPDELENAAYEFVRLYREGGEMHERGGAAVLIESVVFTEEKMQAIGIPAGMIPVGWWIGFKVTDSDVWEKVKDGTYQMFSIEGTAERVETED